MKKAYALLLLVLISCGKSEGPTEVCKPQDIAIAECVVEEFEKNPNRIMIDIQRQYCERLYPINMCYYN